MSFTSNTTSKWQCQDYSKMQILIFSHTVLKFIMVPHPFNLKKTSNSLAVQTFRSEPCLPLLCQLCLWVLEHAVPTRYSSFPYMPYCLTFLAFFFFLHNPYSFF